MLPLIGLKNVRCNALSPGGVLNDQGKEFLEKLKYRIPLGRMANVNEYEAAVQFLCSDASACMTGQNIVIDGGRNMVTFSYTFLTKVL